MNKEKILITGSAGYIGSCLNNFLIKKKLIESFKCIKIKKLPYLPLHL